MQVLLIILIASLYLDDVWSDWDSIRPEWAPWMRAGIALGSFAILIGLCALVQRIAYRRIEKRGEWRAVMVSERSAFFAISAAVFLQLIAVGLWGWVDIVRSVMGDLVLVDELIALAPPLVTMMAVWVLQYPVNRLIREASLMRQLDHDEPIYPVWTRWQFVLAQVRLHFVLILLPILLIISWRELVDKIRESNNFLSPYLAGDASEMTAVALGTGCIFLFAPVMIRHLWDTSPLQPGEIRDRLVQMCREHAIKVREILLWNTFGGMMNGAVMGLIGRLRYVLLTDALLDALTPIQVESVMAHELGHVRRHHLPWLVISMLATLCAASLIVSLMVSGAMYVVTPPLTFGLDQNISRSSMLDDGSSSARPEESFDDEVFATEVDVPTWVEPAGLVVTFALTFFVFGWVSRRFERQADAFAAQHLSGMTRDNKGRDCVITHDAAATMVGTLGMVAQLNHIPPRRKSWRHGSIEWRQQHLRDIVGRACNRLPIDRVVVGIKLASLCIIVFTIGLWLWTEGS